MDTEFDRAVETMSQDADPEPKEQFRTLVGSVLGKAEPPGSDDDTQSEGPVVPEDMQFVPAVTEFNKSKRVNPTGNYQYPYIMICLSPLHDSKPFVVEINGEQGPLPLDKYPAWALDIRHLMLENVSVLRDPDLSEMAKIAGMMIGSHTFVHHCFDPKNSPYINAEGFIGTRAGCSYWSIYPPWDNQNKPDFMQRLKKDATSVASATLATIYMERIPILVLANKSIAIDGKIFMYPHIARITHNANKWKNVYNPRTKRNDIVYDAKQAKIVYDRYLSGCHIV